MTVNNHTLMGTAGGTFLSMIPNIQSEDIVKTAVLATVGAIVSFTISLLLKSLNKKHKKKV
jgi:mannitol-specific phosphotransferase system IIBC component